MYVGGGGGGEAATTTVLRGVVKKTIPNTRHCHQRGNYWSRTVSAVTIRIVLR